MANLVSIKVDHCKEAITEVAVVNIAINYPFDKGLALNNPKNDLVLMQKIFQGHKRQINITDVKDKQTLITTISDFVVKNKADGIKHFVLNYSGHGGVTKDKQEFAFILSQYSCDLQKSAQARDGQQPLSRGLARPIDIASRIVDNNNLNTERVDVIDSKCDAHILKASELKQIFSDVKLTALIDSCFSGLLSDTEGINTIYSAGKNEAAADGQKNGSPFFRSLNEVSEKFYCEYFRTDNNFPNVTLLDFVESLPIVNGKVKETVGADSKYLAQKISNEFENFKKQMPGTGEKYNANDSCIKMDPVSLDINKCPFKSVEITSSINCGPATLKSNDQVKFLNFTSVNNQKLAHVYNDQCGFFNVNPTKINIDSRDSNSGSQNQSNLPSNSAQNNRSNSQK